MVAKPQPNRLRLPRFTPLTLVLLAVGCRDEPPAFRVLPSDKALFAIPAEPGFESVAFGIEGRTSKAPLVVAWRAGADPVRVERFSPAAVEAHASLGFEARIPRAANIDRVAIGGRIVPVRRYEPRRRYRLPLPGCWFVTSGHDFGLEHRRWMNRAHFGWDFGRVDGTGRPNGEGGHYAFGQPVLAPADGVVFLADDRWPDRPPGDPGPASQTNYVLIDHGDGEFSKLAHLRKDSLRVEPGQSVTRGQVLAQVGNSGASDAPHLHLHFQHTMVDEKNVVQEELPLPIPLGPLLLTSHRGVRVPHDAVRPRRGDFVCHLAADLD